MPIAGGTRFHSYVILAPLGAGGMGEVYLAEDMRLRRKVALKLLPEAFTRNVSRLRRFEQEARAASALNHPNILTIHEIGQIDGAHFIATEFIDGQTLRERLKAGALAIPAALDLAIQIAAALVAAHEAGIVHRDIKPENVMVRRDGIVKVLDFGLAKLTESPAVVESEAPTIAKVNTDPGTVLGTANYMSPEQARGQEVDARSDIFSLGLVLYEMVAGRAPFTGANALEVISEILKTEPSPLRSHVPDAPAELQRIVTKALRKDREERYQSIREMLLDLKSLKQELEFEAKLKGVQAFATPASSGNVGTGDISPVNGTTNAQQAGTTGEATPRTTSSAEVILGEIKRHKAGVLIGVVVLLAGAGLLLYGIYRIAMPKQTYSHFQNVKLTRLTSLGNVGEGVSISPDGKFIAYVQKEADKNSLWTKSIVTDSAVQIVPPTDSLIDYPVFSPDGNFVFYHSREGTIGVLFQVPVLGGTTKKVITRIHSPITFSPDGRQLAYARGSPTERGKDELVIASIDGSEVRVLATRNFNEGFLTPSWSPDGRTIATAASSLELSSLDTALLGVSVEGGAITTLIEPRRGFEISDVVWLRDGSGLVLTGNEMTASANQIWLLSYPQGGLRRITNDLTNYSRLALTADGHELVTLQAESSSTLWITQLGAADRKQQLTSRDNRQDGLNGVRWTPEGRIAYTSLASGIYNLWLMSAAGSQAQRITDEPVGVSAFQISPDGKYLVFTSWRKEKINIWRTDINGNNLKQLTDAGIDFPLAVSPDTKWVHFVSWQSEGRKYYKVSIDGGAPILMTDLPEAGMAFSPDGKLVAGFKNIVAPGKVSMITVSPAQGGEPIQTLDASSVAPVGLRWTADGRALLYVDTRQGSSNVWRMPLDGSPRKPVTNFNDAKPERIWSFDLSPDGKQLIVARGNESADAVLISEVK